MLAMTKGRLKTIRIPGTDKILGGEEVFFVAEIGKGFIQTEADQPIESYLANAKRLIDEAVAAGADAVKFQTHEVYDEQVDIPVISPHFKGAERHAWVKRNTEATPLSFWQDLKNYAVQKGIIFFSTAMSRRAAQKLSQVGVPLWKVGSGDVEDYVLLDYLTGTGKPIIISTGMVSFAELDEVVNYFVERSTSLAILYCVSEYPCPPEKFNLASIERIKEKYPEVVVGFSDHSVGDLNPVLAAVKVGARIVEKHFSLSRDLWGSDHKVSMTPAEFAEMVKRVRAGEHKKVAHQKFYGDKERELDGAKNRFRPYFKKSLVAARVIKKGEKITKNMIHALRPVLHLKGLPSRDFHKVVGREVIRQIKKGEPLTNKIFAK
ncbi:MAG: hypothetical protein CEO19_200 [Parcubacteria group bacterium Gr01-1014_73]|nr:MAG: hypothetical protein CEO19_200 [Parcubacteria group bacterium Gr01-1014_73]